MALMHLAIEQGSDPDCDLDASASFATNALASELHGVAGIAHLVASICGTLVLRRRSMQAARAIMNVYALVSDLRQEARIQAARQMS